jgi:FAD/FMN-containing dehydrogenase
MSWARQLSERIKPHAAGTAYIDFMPAEEAGRLQQAYGASHLRLAELKLRYDPANLFRMNHNITAAPDAQAA